VFERGCSMGRLFGLCFSGVGPKVGQLLFTRMKTVPAIRAAQAMGAIGFALALGWGCSGWADADQAMQTRQIARGPVSGLTKAQRLVVTQPEAWARLWAEHCARGAVSQPAPAIDFAKEMVVVLTLGQKPTGGYGIEITRVAIEGNRLKVSYRATSPPAGAMVTQALTSPCHMVAVAKSELKPEFVEVSEGAKR